MIIGNPGIYDSNGQFSNFAIQIDRILDTDNYSINLCIDMNIYPSQLAYNNAKYLMDLFDPKLGIYSNVNDDLFFLNDRELMIRLMKDGFGFIYSIEELIRRDKMCVELLMNNEKVFFDKLNEIEVIESINPYLWEIDNIEYTNRGYYPFIINNSKGESKIVIVFHKSRNYELDYVDNRFLFSENILRDNVDFFDDGFWGVKVSCINTRELNLIIKRVYYFLGL